jgi:hypothetical protein
MYAKFFREVLAKHIESPEARTALAKDLEELTSKPVFPKKVVVFGESKCICCLGEITHCYEDDDGEWHAPGGAIIFKDQGNYGSRLNDSCYDGHYFEVMICDECLEDRRQCIQESDSVGALESRMEDSRESLAALPPSFFDTTDLKAQIALQEVAEAKYKAGTPASELTDKEIEAMKGEYGEDWEANLKYQTDNPEQVWTPERGKLWAKQAIEKATEERKQRLMEQGRKLLEENGYTVTKNVL